MITGYEQYPKLKKDTHIKSSYAVAGKQGDQRRGVCDQNYMGFNPVNSSSNSSRVMSITGIWLLLQMLMKS
jgi:hypothetical protein